ncbi:hypothetical protein Pla123a_43860 [Posidoniimonas polymericola]|uniref:Uncharacterized protein n=1 Tax=Posidoniimonas polymericola TaxID=2528002 RepID=A0A5C5XUM0_9BACT|nr:hypothetical protein Pla123a_43860 [Posidoniimonas polymericola]
MGLAFTFQAFRGLLKLQLSDCVKPFGTQFCVIESSERFLRGDHLQSLFAERCGNAPAEQVIFGRDLNLFASRDTIVLLSRVWENLINLAINLLIKNIGIRIFLRNDAHPQRFPFAITAVLAVDLHRHQKARLILNDAFGCRWHGCYLCGVYSALGGNFFLIRRRVFNQVGCVFLNRVTRRFFRGSRVIDRRHLFRRNGWFIFRGGP